MKRQMQANEIRTNLVCEFAVVGEQSVRTIFSSVMKLMDDCAKEKVNVRLVGVSLKKPTANCVYLSNITLDTDSKSNQPLHADVEFAEALDEASEVVEEESEDDADDTQSDRND